VGERDCTFGVVGGSDAEVVVVGLGDAGAGRCAAGLKLMLGGSCVEDMVVVVD